MTADFINRFIEDSDNLEKFDYLTKEDIDRIKGGRNLALEIAVRFHLAEHL